VRPTDTARRRGLPIAAAVTVALAAVWWAGDARAETPETPSSDEELRAQAPSPVRDTSDWIRFDSGEWLRGKIKLLRNKDLEFESDELDVLYLDWDDVVELRSGRLHTYVLDDLTWVTGTAVMVAGEIAIDVEGEVRRYERNRIAAIVAGRQSELDYWYVKGFAGLSAASGNTDLTELTGDFLLRRETPTTRAQLRYLGSYGTADHVKNSNNHRGFSRFDYFLTRYFFLSPALFEVFSDEFQNISYRLSGGPGVGYILVQNPITEWEATAAAGPVYTRFDSAEPGDSNNRLEGALFFGTSLDTEITSRLDLLAGYRLMLTAPDPGDTNHHGEATLSFEVTSFLDLDTKFIWDRIESPSREANGNRPDSDDFRFVVGISIDY